MTKDHIFLTAEGLYDPQFEHDACGVGFIANINGTKSNRIISDGIRILENLVHRGACGCDPETGDGAGILIQVPDRFFRQAELKCDLPPAGQYGVGMVFLPRDQDERHHCERIIEKAVAEEGQHFLVWRDVPVDNRRIGRQARLVEPVIRQFLIGNERTGCDETDFERLLYIIRKSIERTIAMAQLRQASYFYICSLSCRTINYKGLLLAHQIASFYQDLTDTSLESALALVHQRFSTNTFPTWDLAHPYRMLAHNGEINTLRGNRNWMRARQSQLESPLFGKNIGKLFPICNETGSDSATIDNALEFLVQGGRSLAHSILMLIPEAWQGNPYMDADKRAFYEYHACLMEPWDGPAAIAFTDGRSIGAVLDRNGLRPARYLVTKDGQVVMASETGVLDVPPENIAAKGRLQPGKVFLVDLTQQRIIDDEELKHQFATQKPYRQWLHDRMIHLKNLPAPPRFHEPDHDTILQRQQAFGYTVEDIRILMAPMATQGEEPVGSMGTDTPLAALSKRPQLLYNYFKQLFAQVTNPAIDPIREELVMSLIGYIGTDGNLLDETPLHCRQLRLDTPILTNAELEQIRHLSAEGFRTVTLPIFFEAKRGACGLEQELKQLCEQASREVAAGSNILVLSDRGVDAHHVPIPSLLAVSAVHHHLIREGTRTRVGLVLESGEAREVHHYALLIGYGVSAINPYLAFETLSDMIRQHLLPPDVSEENAYRNYIKAINKGLYKTFSKMGISTIQSYCGAQIFEAIGLHPEVVDKYFTGTASRISGVKLDVIAQEALARHEFAYPPARVPGNRDLDSGGQYQWRRDGEFHQLNPDSIAKLQIATHSGSYETFKEFSAIINRESEEAATLRGLLKFKAGNSIPIEEVEPASEIVKRFATGAMSFGSISREAHETLAIAMNRMGGRSNTGEGGEDPTRFKRDPNGDLRRSAIKQVASARFGVTTEYLVNADELQIKIAQGAKPGEGGQLPGRKVDKFIAKVRFSTPGVTLISPPPHHDIYSIEDLAQLIFDLKNVNPQARISVKLVAEVGVGTVAAGVAKAHADLVLISGYDGGTGASPLSSIKHAGIPWELGLAETQQVLVKNDLRSRIRVQTDGQLKTGRDVVIAALLGAEEFGFSSAPLVTLGCIMMRVCHLNTCPVGIATQDPVLRSRFAGKPEYVINFFTFVAEEVRELMAQLGFRTFEEMVGRVDMLETQAAVDHWKARGLDLTPLLTKPAVPNTVPIHCQQAQDHGIDHVLDRKLIKLAKDALENRCPVEASLPIRNSDRTVATMLSGEVAKRYGLPGLEDGTIRLKFTGSAGQSFGAFLANGIELTLAGDANDYMGKGISGGRIIVVPQVGSTFVPSENIIAGNTLLYGATGGEVFIHGVVGERFAVRNSGARAVVEGAGDHCCEYMTGGVVVVLGKTGRNFAAGMSGGVAYVYDLDGLFHTRANDGHGSILFEAVSDEEDITILHNLVEQHYRYTNSERARHILDEWVSVLPRFIKVISQEYKDMIAEVSRDVSELVMRV